MTDFNPAMLPYGGDWWGLPRWLRADLTTLKLVERWWALNGSLPSSEGLPKLDEA